MSFKPHCPLVEQVTWAHRVGVRTAIVSAGASGHCKGPAETAEQSWEVSLLFY